MRTLFGILFITQLLVAAYLFGNALKQRKEYRTPFGKLFLPYGVQVTVTVWLIISLFANVLFAYCM